MRVLSICLKIFIFNTTVNKNIFTEFEYYFDNFDCIFLSRIYDV